MYKFVMIGSNKGILASIDWAGFRFDKPIVFTNGTDAVDYLRNHRADAILTDISGKDMTAGWEHIRQIRTIIPKALVIVYADSREFDDVVVGIRAGIFDYCLKPMTKEEAEQMMERVLSRLELNPRRSRKGTGETCESIISMSKKYIEDNLNNNIRLETLARFVHMNPTYFSRYFKKHTGQKLIDYITELRIKRAIELMQNPTNKIYQIGYRVGYKNLQHFYKIFKKTMGMTPNEYRKQFYGAPDEPAVEEFPAEEQLSETV